MRFITILALCFTLAACGGSKDRSGDGSIPSQQAKGVTISESEKGKTNWFLSASYAEFFTEPTSYVVLKTPHLIVQNSGAQDSDIKSKEGHYDIDKHIITMSGNVVGYSKKEGATIKTEKVFYSTETKKVWVNTPVTLTRGGVTVKGQGLKANADFSEIELIKQQTTIPQTVEEFESSAKI